MTEKPEPAAAPQLPVSLRDYFSGQVLSGLCANPSLENTEWSSIAESAYAAADAFLAERAKSEPTP